MRHALKKLFLSSALFLLVPAAGAQDSEAAKPVLDFSHDPCGNPMMESQLWIGVEGTVTRVVDGRTILLNLPNRSKPVRVHLVAITLQQGGPFAEKATEVLRKKLLNQPVEVLVNPSKWDSDKPPAKATGMVQLKEGAPSDVGLWLLGQGLARFKTPQRYAMSGYSQCEYRRAEEEARSNKSGLWQ